jgi:hypothetical protein
MGACILPHDRILLAIWSKSYHHFEFYHLSLTGKLTKLILEKTPEIPPEYNDLAPDACEIFVDNRGSVQLFATFAKNHLLFSESSKYGKDWTPFVHINNEETAGFITGKPVLVEQTLYVGRIILPVEHPIYPRAAALISQDNGKTWHQSLYIEPEEDDEVDQFTDNNESSIQMGTKNPVMIEEKDNKIRVFFVQSQRPQLFTTLSEDLGETWNIPEVMTELPIDITAPFDAITLHGKSGELSSKQLLAALSLKYTSDSDQNIKQDLIVYIREGKQTQFMSVFGFQLDELLISAVKILEDDHKHIHIIALSNLNKIIHYELKPDSLIH